MLRLLLLTALLAVTPFPSLAGDASKDGQDAWPQWRGPTGNGVAVHGNPPLTWSETKNVRWKTALPGKGQSTPVIWGERIFVTAAIPHGPEEKPHGGHDHGAHDNVVSARRQKLVVLALDRRDGSILWERTVYDGLPHASVHSSGTWASNSAVTDGEHVIAFFGSGGLYGLNVKGKLLWEKNLGEMQVKHGHGEGASPALHGNTVIVNWDHEGDSFVIALDKRNGKQLWKVARDEGTSWSSPLVLEHDGKTQVVIAATNRVRAYDLADGKLIWECGGLSGNVVASPVAADGHVYVGSSYEKRAMLAIRLSDAKGDITGTDAVVWKRDRDTPYVPSPLLYEDTLCFLKHYQGIFTCVKAKTGEPLLGPRRLQGVRNVYASPIGAAGRIYIVGMGGSTLVLRKGGEFEPLALNALDDQFAASPAVAGDALFLRGENSLYCLAEDQELETIRSPTK
jgi:outer membrane protein assembly factor BamB